MHTFYCLHTLSTLLFGFVMISSNNPTHVARMTGVNIRRREVGQKKIEGRTALTGEGAY
jgi:hypothetical protein